MLDRVPKRYAALPALAVVAMTMALGACAPDAAAEAQSQRGDAVGFGDGDVSTYVERDAAGLVTAIGVRLSASTFDALPTEPDGTAPCFDADGDGVESPETECVHMLRRDLDLPDAALEAAAPFGYVQFNYNPQGHPPPAPPVYAEPHFDVHFFLVGLDDVEAIRTGTCGFLIDCDVFERARVPVPAAYMPPGYIEVGAAAGEEGNHLLLSTAPELGDPPAEFRQTFIYGSLDGHIVFLEPMIAASAFESGLDECHEIPQPAAWEVPGWYPTRYCMHHLPAEDAYTVSLESFVRREAT